MFPTRHWALGAAFIVSMIVMPSMGIAQPVDIPGPQPNWDFAFRSEVVANDNAELADDPLGTTSYWVNTLTLANRSETRTSRFAADVSGHLRYLDTPESGDEVRFDDPQLDLQYNRAVGDDSIGLTVFARRVDIIFFDTLAAPSISNDFDFDDTRGTGSLENYGGQLFGTINEDSPITLRYNFEGFQRRYIDTTDPDLEDITRYRAGIETLFDLTRTVRGAFDIGYDYRDTDDAEQTLRRQTTAATGLNIAIDEVNQLNFRIGYSRVNTEEQAFNTEEIEEGVVGGINYQRELVDGFASLGFSSTFDENGRRDTISGGRTWIRETSTFGGSIGASANELTEDVSPVGNLFFEQDLPRSNIRADLAQSAGLDNDSFNSIFTRLNLNYEQELVEAWRFNLRMAAARRFREEDENEETIRLDVAASVSADINAYWSLDFGYRYIYREGDDSSVSSSNSIFAALVRPLQIE